jgi:sigma-B regulation protein RsbU (phosphoserine phosphatase)
MAVDIYPQVQEALKAKQKEITDLLEAAPAEKKEICLCEDEGCVEEHLHVIETSLKKIENKTLGFCVVCHGYVDSSHLEMDYTASVCLDHYSDEERRRLEAELELSQVVQRALLPQRIPNIQGVELAAFSRPSEIIGGDYFDFFQYRDGAHGLVIADVSGHGVSAGMLMSSLQTALRTLAPDTDSPAEILERINRFYIHNIHFTTFVTVFLARFDPTNLSFTYVNAGHNPPLVYRRSESNIAWLKPTAPAIGLVEDFQPRTESVVFSRGDSILFYTDGVTEVLNTSNREFGMEALAELFRRNADLRAPDMLQVVRQSVSAFGDNKPLADDVTMITLKVSG